MKIGLLCSAIAASSEQTELQIDRLGGPEDCVRKSQAGDKISVHYKGTLLDGTVFDESTNRGPFQFTLGVGQVIKGWDQGCAGMCIGEKRKLVIPSDLAYGKRGAGGVIKPDATLVFEVELLGISGYDPSEAEPIKDEL